MSKDTQQEILEIVTFLKDNALTKEEAVTNNEFNEGLSGLRNELRGEMHQMKDELMTHMDGFITLHKTLDVELAALRSK